MIDNKRRKGTASPAEHERARALLHTPETPDWAQLESDVILKIRLLRAAWEHTADSTLHAGISRDLYIPALTLLAEFCSCVEVHGDDDAKTS